MFALLESAKHGDVNSINELCDLAINVVKATLHKKLSNSKLDFDDLAQDSLLAVSKDLHSSKATSKGEFVAWVKTITFNTLCSAHSKKSTIKSGAKENIAALSSEWEPSGGSPTAEKIALAKEALAEVEVLLAKMQANGGEKSKVTKIIGMLSEGWTAAEISDATGSTVMAVNGVIKRFRASLKDAGLSLS